MIFWRIASILSPAIVLAHGRCALKALLMLEKLSSVVYRATRSSVLHQRAQSFHQPLRAAQSLLHRRGIREADPVGAVFRKVDAGHHGQAVLLGEVLA